MRIYRDKHVHVMLSAEGLRRAYNDNALKLAASRRNETMHAAMTWLAVIGLGVLIGWSACNGIAA